MTMSLRIISGGVFLLLAFCVESSLSQGCQVIRCGGGKVCVEDSDGSGSCVCPTVCTEQYDPVCGSNGKTYSSECQLLSEACTTNTQITVAHKGACTACDRITCLNGRVCEEDSNGNVKCVCKTGCTKQYDPVCGSNGKNYSNECMLLAEACTTSRKISVAHKGACTACDLIQCVQGRSCIVNKAGEAECVCPQFCTLQYAPVCGTNGVTYGNGCQLGIATCESNGAITKARDGACDQV